MLSVSVLQALCCHLFLASSLCLIAWLWIAVFRRVELHRPEVYLPVCHYQSRWRLYGQLSLAVNSLGLQRHLKHPLGPLDSMMLLSPQSPWCIQYLSPVLRCSLSLFTDIMHPNYPRLLLVQIHSVSKEELTWHLDLFTFLHLTSYVQSKCFGQCGN